MKAKRKTIIGIIISFLFLILIFHNVNIKELFDAFKQFEPKNLAMIVFLYAFSMFVRAFRWRMLLSSDKRFSVYSLCSTWVIGNLLNAFLPARAGDVWRAYELGAQTQESKMKLFGSVILERILDGVSICVMLYCCVIMYANLIWIRRVADWSILLFGGSLICAYFIVKFNKVAAICSWLVNSAGKLPLKLRILATTFAAKLSHQVRLFISGFDVLQSGYYTFQSIVLSFATWFLECLITYFVVTSFGINCSPSAALFVICFVALGAMLPSSSIFVGPYQYAYILALGIYFVPKTEALAVAFVHQSILMGSLIVFSAVFWCINLIISLKSDKKSESESLDTIKEVCSVINE